MLYLESGHLDPDSGSTTDWVWGLNRLVPSSVPSVARWPCSGAKTQGPWSWAGSFLLRLTSCSSSVDPRLLGCPFSVDHLLYLLGIFCSELILHSSWSIRWSHFMWDGMYLGHSVLRDLVTLGTQQEGLIIMPNTYWALTVYQALL